MLLALPHGRRVQCPVSAAIVGATLADLAFFALVYAGAGWICGGWALRRGRNSLVGVRIPWTWRSEAHWRIGNRYFASLFRRIAAATLVPGAPVALAIAWRLRANAGAAVLVATGTAAAALVLGTAWGVWRLSRRP